jgi:hypothetical protein
VIAKKLSVRRETVCRCGEPKFRQLEPDLGLAAPDRGTSTRGLIPRDGSADIRKHLSVDEVIDQFDGTREQVEAVLDFVAESLRSDVATGARPV